MLHIGVSKQSKSSSSGASVDVHDPWRLNLMNGDFSLKASQLGDSGTAVEVPDTWRLNPWNGDFSLKVSHLGEKVDPCIGDEVGLAINNGLAALSE
jgi:hypothetical protein